MKDDRTRDDWQKRLRPFDTVWARVQGEHRPPPPGPPAPPPPRPAPPPPPGRGCCTRAVRFNPHGGRR